MTRSLRETERESSAATTVANQAIWLMTATMMSRSAILFFFFF